MITAAGDGDSELSPRPCTRLDELGHRTRKPSTRSLAYWLTVGAAIAFGVYLRHEALTFTFHADDYAQLEMLEGRYPLPRAPYDLFNFSNGSLDEARRLIDVGFYPWWTDPELRVSFLRPLASLSIWLDHRLFGHSPFGYHLNSAIAWCAMALAVAALYRRVLPSRQALIAFAILVCSVAHAGPFWWICNRSVLVTTMLQVLALLAYRRYRISESWAFLVLAVSTSSVAFLFGEYAFCALGYFVAYELCCGQGSLAQRSRSLAWMLLPAAMFIVARTVVDASVRNSGIYVDPFGEPLAFLAATLERLPVLVGDLLFVLQADHWTAHPPWIREWVDEGWVPAEWFVNPSHWRLIQVGVGSVACVLVWIISRHAGQRPERRTTQWLTLGSVLSLFTVVGSFPSSRLLIMAAIGFSALLAALIVDGLSKLRQRHEWRGLSQPLLVGLACCLLAYHVIIPVALQRLVFSNPVVTGIGMRRALLRMDVDQAALPSQDLIMLTAFDGGASMYLPATRRLYGRSAPRSCMTLSYVHAPYLLMRVSVNRFDIRFFDTTVMMRSGVEQLFRSPRRPLRLDESVEAGPFRATIVELQDGLPKRIGFEFDRPLEAPSLLFMITTPDGLEKFELPPVGATIKVPAPAIPITR